MPLIPQQQVLSVGGAGSTDGAVKSLHKMLAIMPPVRIVSVSIASSLLEFSKAHPATVTWDLVAVVEHV